MVPACDSRLVTLQAETWWETLSGGRGLVGGMLGGHFIEALRHALEAGSARPVRGGDQHGQSCRRM